MKYLYSLLTIILTTYIILSPGIKNSGGLEFLNICIAIICSVGLFSYEKNPFSMFKIFNIFFLFFFCIAPILQFKNDIHLLGTFFTEQDYILTSLYSLFILIIYDLVYIIKFANQSNTSNRIDQVLIPKVFIPKKKILLMLLISSTVCFCILWMNNFNVISLFIRGGDAKEGVDVSSIA